MTNKRMRETYDAIAPEYAAINRERRPQIVSLGERFLALVPPGALVLDLGCGAGRDMEWTEERGARVVGTDLSAGMLAQARERVRGPLVQADMRYLPIVANTFGGVWCMASLLHMPKADAPIALAEIKRVLVPGGVLAVGLHEGEGETWEPWQTPMDRPVERFFSRYSQHEAEALLTEAGFEVKERGRTQTEWRYWLQFLASSQC